MRNPIGSEKRPKRINILCYATVMVSSTLFIILTQIRKQSAYDFNLTLVILEIKGMPWNSCSLTYNLTILTKLSLHHKKKNTQTMFMALMPQCFIVRCIFFCSRQRHIRLPIVTWKYLTLREDYSSVPQMLFLVNLEIHNIIFRWFRNVHSCDADGRRKSYHFDVNQSERTLHRNPES